MFRLSPCLLALVVFSLPLGAQELPKENPADAPAAPDERLQPSGHVSVEVVLKNEAVFLGVALKGRLVEKCIRHQYRPLEPDQQAVFGAGLRVWYYDDLLGFLFIPYRQIAEVKVGAELSNDQLDRLKAKVQERRLAKEAAREGATRPAEKPKDAESKAPGVEAVQDALLRRFPPTEGFTPERYEQIQRAAITGGETVSAREKDWVKVFPDWLKAYKQAAAAPNPAPKPGSDEPRPEVADEGAETEPEVRTDGVTIGVKTPRPQGESSGGDAGRGLH